MKQLKRCDGYVLPYVLVVFLILSAVAVSICTVSLNNLKAQEAAVKRAQALYQAEGEIEKITAKISSYTVNATHPSYAQLRSWFIDGAESIVGKEGCSTKHPTDDTVFTLKVDAVAGEVCVEAVLHVQLNIEYSHTVTSDEGGNISFIDYYKISNSKVTYESYNISYEGGGAE